MVFGFEHGSHFLQVGMVTLLLKQWGEEDGDDPLCDVGEVEVVVPLHHSLHHPIHAEAPVPWRGEEKNDGGDKRVEKICWQMDKNKG